TRSYGDWSSDVCSSDLLVHGSLYAHHVLDLGDGPGLIDWQKSGQGPAELDAGVFLATLWRLGMLQERLAGEVARAEEVFLAETRSEERRVGRGWRVAGG